MSEIGKIMGELYKHNYEHHFRHHPKKDEIIPHLVDGTFESTAQVDLWFAEADAYSWQALMNAPKPEADESGTVTFKVVD